MKGLGSAARLLLRISCHAMAMPRRRLSLEQRLTMLPLENAPISRPVAIYWDRNQVPFIEADTDADLATTLGIVHAHLRLAQMELMRRVSQGRLSEVIGRFGLEIDKFARTFDVGRATPAILEMMPSETRIWLECFARGINHYLSYCRQLPAEFRVLGLGREPWSSADIVTLGRLVAADVNWIVWVRLLRFRKTEHWPVLWQRLLRHDTLSLDSVDSSPALGTFGAMLATSRSGSNSLAVSGARSASGAPLIANDPHLGIMLPNPWLLAGMKSPSHHGVGCMLPGIPFIAFGRNPWIAWGGTNLHAASSDLVGLPSGVKTRLRKEAIAVKGEPDSIIEIPESDWGPIISHLSAFATADERLALRWMGHRPSDEFTAMLRVGRARNCDEFRAAFSGYALPGLQFNVAEISGRVGAVTAVRVPRRDSPPEDLATSPDNGWDEILGSSELPWISDPPSGFIAAANARPEDDRIRIGYFFSPPDRMQRIGELLQDARAVTVDDLMALQRDVHLSRALAERDLLLAWFNQAPSDDGARSIVDALKKWDGNYEAESEGALALELVSYHLARRLVSRDRLQTYDAAWGTRALVWEDFHAADPAVRSRAVCGAIHDAGKNSRGKSWGSYHRLRLVHGFGRIPFFGRAFRFADLPASGNSETLMKTAHGMSNRRHAATYGSVARHISDLSGPDWNYFCLLGGQDGWLGSANFADQVALWRKSEYLFLPLLPESVRAMFPHCTRLKPKAA